MSHFDDEKLKKFLQDNRPVAPEAPRGELQAMLSRLGLEPRVEKPSRFAWWAFGGGAFATAVAVAWFLMLAPKITAPTSDIEELETEFSMDHMPLAEVGDEFLALASDTESL
jgi:hypothetical protein